MTTARLGSIRIIGGRWRGSKLPVPDAAGLRPTTDRIRETLFNWLQPFLPGARVLDLFAGTGALGLEAASRGAASVVLVERDATLAASLRASAERLGKSDAGAHVEVACADALGWLGREPAARFDIAFVDPPFAASLWQPALDALLPWLADDALVYVESPRDAPAFHVEGFAPHREGATREVRYALQRRRAGTLGGITSAEQDPARA